MRPAAIRLFFQKTASRSKFVPFSHPTTTNLHFGSVLSPSSSKMRFYGTAASLSAVTAMLPLGSQAWVSPFVGSDGHLPRSNLQAVSPRWTSTTAVSAGARSSSSSSSVEESFSAAASAAAAATPPMTASPVHGKSALAIAEGWIVAQFPGGMTAVRINEDLTSSISTTTASNAAATNEKMKQQPSLLGATPEFLAASKNSASAGDYQGKQVVYPDGSTGVVVAHRPPLIFCYSSEDPSVSPVPNNKNGLVQVLDRMATLTVSPTIHVVDCWGNAIADNDTVDSSSNDDNNTNKKGKQEPAEASSILAERAIFAPIPKVAHIALINNPMLTGNTMMDTLAPVGRGQNMLLIGHALPPMRDLALDFLQTQIRATTTTHTKCIYASTDPHDREAALKRLRDAGIASDVHFVGTQAEADQNHNDDEESRAAEAVLIASTACAVAESYALEKGMHALVVVDNIDSHKKFWDATTRVLVDVFGVDAVVKSDREGGASSEMRSFYSSLIQRAGQYNQKRGGGSVTLLLLTTIPSNKADDDTVFQPTDFDQGSERIKERIHLLVEKKIPLTASTLRKISIPIPTVFEGERRLVLQHIDDLISMSDGQVWLDEDLEASGQEPPMDPQRSVTRIGIGADTQSRADAPAIRRIAEGMRLELSQAASMEGTEVTTTATQKQIRRQRALLLAMHQPAGSGGRRLSESCTVLLAAKQGFLDRSIDEGALAGTEKGDRVMKQMLDHVRTTAAVVMDEIDKSLDISEEMRTALIASISSFFET